MKLLAIFAGIFLATQSYGIWGDPADGGCLKPFQREARQMKAFAESSPMERMSELLINFLISVDPITMAIDYKYTTSNIDSFKIDFSELFDLDSYDGGAYPYGRDCQSFYYHYEKLKSIVNRYSVVVGIAGGVASQFLGGLWALPVTGSLAWKVERLNNQMKENLKKYKNCILLRKSTLVTLHKKMQEEKDRLEKADHNQIENEINQIDADLKELE